MHHVHIRAGLAVHVLVCAVPAYLRIGAVEHKQSLASVYEYLVFDEVVVTHPAQMVGSLTAGGEGVGHPNVASEYRVEVRH